MLLARVPVYGKLRFKNAPGATSRRGINVGDEWTYRSFIEGGGQAAAIWTFEGIKPVGVSRRPAGGNDHRDLPHLQGRHRARHPRQPPGPQTGQRREAGGSADLRGQEVRHRRAIHPPRVHGSATARRSTCSATSSTTGSWRCGCNACRRPSISAWPRPISTSAARDASFALNFAKGYLGIWLQMVLVIGIGVMFSTFLSGPVALLATLAASVAAFFVRLPGRAGLGQDRSAAGPWSRWTASSPSRT